MDVNRLRLWLGLIEEKWIVTFPDKKYQNDSAIEVDGKEFGRRPGAVAQEFNLGCYTFEAFIFSLPCPPSHPST